MTASTTMRRRHRIVRLAGIAAIVVTVLAALWGERAHYAIGPGLALALSASLRANSPYDASMAGVLIASRVKSH